jgi:hypothetical protein
MHYSRTNGARLPVDPGTPSIVWFGSRQGAATFAPATSRPSCEEVAGRQAQRRCGAPVSCRPLEGSWAEQVSRQTLSARETDGPAGSLLRHGPLSPGHFDPYTLAGP